MAGDFNAHSPSWGSPSMCAKGDALTDMANSLGLIVINQGRAPTFERRGQESHIDVTFAVGLQEDSGLASAGGRHR